ncbi:AraC family transcriptional regulator [Pedobacter frigidisoli]|uniref:AraC family transcriptional regulator n=1 Tax=Pedobacter frigidisoli TaxID=2530455 RepID=A0A4R0P2J9_9SPHI|nr:helix-turn-helix transcriptional regulator [Pedobacter frigidisoli]TCD08293.1 AraC family transcriptional regulator [Pedobacter frigidisoli]
MRRIRSISEFHSLRGLSQPEHPLVSVVDMEDIKVFATAEKMVFDFYLISLKHSMNVKAKYGQQAYGLNEGILSFMSPNQVLGLEINDRTAIPTGQMLLIHEDFLWNTSLARNIKHYDYFDYSVNEALFLSGKEEKVILEIIEHIKQEYHSNIDKFSKQIMVSHIETLLNYAERFYNRQFTIREKNHHQILERLEVILTAYFDNDDLIAKGIPTVQYIAESLNLSASYLGSLLRVLTGQNTQQHIHEKLIDKAKEKLSVTNLSVTEIAYTLGFEHPQSFSKLFKTKTDFSPSAFRQSFN